MSKHITGLKEENYLRERRPCEGPFRARWISLLGMLSKKAIREPDEVINVFFFCFCSLVGYFPQ